ncbi:hypothetical protein N8Z27_01110 [Crocinitomicaceae bacterium]|jgi:hypothetical protein|nr:hypothetical protein [Crocinitomicaceae bacterium]|tara:strand:+ start:290 stop:445 length:156 start_codon:yes stop_codon:yes gene_type:complete
MNEDWNHEDRMEFYAKEKAHSTKQISNWVLFFGVITIIGLVVVLMITLKFV